MSLWQRLNSFILWLGFKAARRGGACIEARRGGACIERPISYFEAIPSNRFVFNMVKRIKDTSNHEPGCKISKIKSKMGEIKKLKKLFEKTFVAKM